MSQKVGSTHQASYFGGPVGSRHVPEVLSCARLSGHVCQEAIQRALAISQLISNPAVVEPLLCGSCMC